MSFSWRMCAFSINSHCGSGGGGGAFCVWVNGGTSMRTKVFEDFVENHSYIAVYQKSRRLSWLIVRSKFDFENSKTKRFALRSLTNVLFWFLLT